MGKKYAVITFLFNHYDLLREPLVIDENAEYYCLTDDNELSSENWKCIYINEFDTDKLTGVQKTYMCKYSFYKYLPQEYEYFITIDASIQVTYKLSDIINYAYYNNCNIGLSLHPERSNWNDEYKSWVKIRGLDEKYVKFFNDFSLKNGFDPNEENGLIECTIKIYKNEKNVLDFIDEIYKVLKENNNFEDKNEQCYFTCVYYKYIGILKPFYFTRQLYSNSKYFASYYHKTNNKWVNDVKIEDNPNILFGKKVKLINSEQFVNNVDIFIGTQKTFTPAVTNDAYKIVVGNHEIENNSNLELIQCKHDSLMDDRFYSEIYMLSHVAKECPLKKYVGFCHNRRYFNFLDNIPNLDEIFEQYDAVVAKPLVCKTTVKNQYASTHNIEDLYIIGGILAEKFPDYCTSWRNFISGKILIPYNMFIMKKNDFIKYINFINTILNEYIITVGGDIEKRIENNKDKYLKMLYPNNDPQYQYRIGGYLAERLTNVFIMTHFKKMKTYPVIVTEDKYRQNKKDNS